MKILVFHNKYRQSGGEDSVVAAEAELLAEHGHDVELWSTDNKDLPTGLSGNIKTALSAAYSYESRAIAREKLIRFQPDVVHVHNFFPQISPSIYDACAEAGAAVVQTLHNYRLICPGALLLRNGEICELCVNGSPYQAVRYGCYRGSKMGTLAVANMVALHRRRQTWEHKVGRFIALTEIAKTKFVEAGFPAHKIAVKPNFVKDYGSEPFKDMSERPYALFVGRLSPEKGIATLIDAWQKLDGLCRLKVAGDGPLAALLNQRNTVEPLGFRPPETIRALMRQAAFLIMPSECYEGFPMALVEAYSLGLPVIASKLGSMAEIVADGETGLLFKPGDAADLAAKAKWLLEHPQQARMFGENARRTYLAKYTPEQNYRRLMAIYADAGRKPLNYA